MSTGYIAPTYDEIRSAIITIWKASYGANADVSSDTVDGLMIDLNALGNQKIYDALGELYNQSKFGTATGLNIDALLELFGSLRVQATSTTCEVWFYGVDTTVVPATSKVATIDTGINLATASPVTISFGVFSAIVLPALPTTTLVSVTIGAAVTAVNTDGTAEEVRNDVAVALTGNANVLNVWGIGTQPDGRAIILIEKTSTWSESIIGAGAIYPATLGFVSAVSTGPSSAAMGTITRIVDTLTDWIGVVNVIDATSGARAQSDAQYKASHAQQLASKGKATPRALEGALLGLPGVTDVQVYENTSSIVDAWGRPPNSFESVVIGGDSLAIGETIWLYHTTGTRSYGSTSVIVTDDRGLVSIDRTMNFSRPTYRYAWARISISRGEGFPSLSLSDIQALISNAVETFGAGLGIGGDIYVAQVSGVVTANLAGVAAVTIELATTVTIVGPPSYGFSSISIDEREISSWSATRVEVIV